MNTIRFNNYDAFAMRMVNDVMSGKWTTAVLFFDDAAELVKAIIRAEKDVIINGIDLNPEIMTGYNREYLVSFDEEFVLSVEPLWHEDNEYHKAGYLSFDADVCYVDGNAHNAAIEYADRDACYEVTIDEEIEKFGYCEDCELENCVPDYIYPFGNVWDNMMNGIYRNVNDTLITVTGYI